MHLDLASAAAASSAAASAAVDVVADADVFATAAALRSVWCYPAPCEVVDCHVLELNPDATA